MSISLVLVSLVGSGLVMGCAQAQGARRHAVRDRVSADDAVSSVLAISIDGLNPAALERLGVRGTPSLHELAAAGASTLNARTERELTITLPNHTGMVTGRRIDSRLGGHGVTWNDDRPDPGHGAARGRDRGRLGVLRHPPGGRLGGACSPARPSSPCGSGRGPTASTAR